MTINRKALSGTALVVLAVLFVALLLRVNVVFQGLRRPDRGSVARDDRGAHGRPRGRGPLHAPDS